MSKVSGYMVHAYEVDVLLDVVCLKRIVCEMYMFNDCNIICM